MPRLTLYFSEADADIIEQAKIHAANAGQSVSSLVVDILASLKFKDRVCPHVTCHICKGEQC